MRSGLLAMTLGLIYILLLYAAVPLGLLALTYGIYGLAKARKDPAGRIAPAGPESDDPDAQPPLSPYDFAVGMIWLGVILVVVGASVNAYRYFGM